MTHRLQRRQVVGGQLPDVFGSFRNPHSLETVTRWESRLAECIENVLFADEQVTDPYRRWYHRHLFHEVPDGVAIEDVVEYAHCSPSHRP